MLCYTRGVVFQIVERWICDLAWHIKCWKSSCRFGDLKAPASYLRNCDQAFDPIKKCGHGSPSVIATHHSQCWHRNSSHVFITSLYLTLARHNGNLPCACMETCVGCTIFLQIQIIRLLQHHTSHNWSAYSKRSKLVIEISFPDMHKLTLALYFRKTSIEPIQPSLLRSTSWAEDIKKNQKLRASHSSHDSMIMAGERNFLATWNFIPTSSLIHFPSHTRTKSAC